MPVDSGRSASDDGHQGGGSPAPGVVAAGAAGPIDAGRHAGRASQFHMAPPACTPKRAFNNALAETTIGLYKTECVRADSPFRRGPCAP